MIIVFLIFYKALKSFFFEWGNFFTPIALTTGFCTISILCIDRIFELLFLSKEMSMLTSVLFSWLQILRLHVPDDINIFMMIKTQILWNTDD